MGVCVRGHRCRDFDATTEAAGRAWPPARLCPRCLNAAASDVAALPRDYAELARELVKAPRELVRIGAGSHEPPAPLALHVEALRADIVWAATVWEQPVREAARLVDGPGTTVRAPWALQNAVSVLAPRVALLSGLESIWGYADGLEAGPVARDGLYGLDTLCRLHRQARAVVGTVRRVWRMPGECSGCGAAALLRRDGGDTVRCGVCHRTWSYADYQRYVGWMLAEYGGSP
jgi:hypothetical protein